ncbi:MAG: hypothetical protein LUE23_07785, partial [Lachnospiraceae bacterium]|nr:hypothetical protein [Lachnospiraceae bacterium]
ILWLFKKIRKIQEINWSKAGQFFIIISPFIFLLFSYAVHWMYDADNTVWVRLNQWLSTRLALGHAAVLNIPHTLFGQKITWNDWAEPLGFGSYFFVDNAYIYIMIKEGIVYTMMILLGYACVIRKAIKEKRDGLILAILGCLIFGLADPELADPRFQPMILLIGWMLCPGNAICQKPAASAEEKKSD